MIARALVDAHSHLYPRAYVELLKRRTALPRIVERDGREWFRIFPDEEPDGGRAFGPAFWDVREKLAFMERSGISRSVISLGNPWLDALDDDGEIARAVNAELAALEAATDGRLVALGALPSRSVASAVQTAREIAETPGLYGIAGGCRICGLPLDDRRLEPLWEALAETGLPLLVHPHSTVGGDELGGYGRTLPIAFGFPFETTLALARLVLGGTLQRFPRVRILAAHGGGTIPFLAGRLDTAWAAERSTPDPRAAPPSRDLRAVYLDSVLYDADALRAAAAFAGTRHVVFGTDHPFTGSDVRSVLGPVDEALSGEALEDVLCRSAESLFGLEPQ